MQHKNRRFIYTFDFKVSPNPPEAPPITMDDIAAQLKVLMNKGEAVHMTRGDEVATRISDIAINPQQKTLKVLIQYADTNASDPAFVHLKKGDLRVEPKLAGEGVATTAHFVVSTEATPVGSNRYVCALEDVSGISRSHIQPFLPPY